MFWRRTSTLPVGLLLLCACTSPGAKDGPAGSSHAKTEPSAGAVDRDPSATEGPVQEELMIGAPDEETVLQRRIQEMPAPEGADASAAVLIDALRQGRRKFIAAKAGEDLRIQMRRPEFDALSYAILGMGELFFTAPGREKLDEGGTKSVYAFGPGDNPEAYTLTMIVEDGLLTDFAVEGDDLPQRLVSYRGRLAPLQFLDLYRANEKGGVRSQGEVMKVGEKHPFHYHLSGLQPGEDGKGHFTLSAKLTNHGTKAETLLGDKVVKECTNVDALTQFVGRVNLGVKEPGTYTLDLLIEDSVSGGAVALSEPFLVVPTDFQ